ncbi:hypothetical protein GLOIN_2v1473341 [Rhizophagus clarus]|uniref:SAM domain-containing protein n=1 Tax=Rhizophagus clarus TaxID=94130 RepID=A0A8H3LKE1_9GLOM|nr:hypothetical protein GLOIN_2v1473341 [Rhizophagus clarus]
MTEQVTCKYLPNTCYLCQKCLFCFQFSQKDSYNCKKTKQLSRTKTSKHNNNEEDNGKKEDNYKEYYNIVDEGDEEMLKDLKELEDIEKLEEDIKSRDYTISYKAVNTQELSNTFEDRKSCSIREDDLTNEEKMRYEVITVLYAKYKCNTHITLYYIQDNRHLQLNSARLQLWTREIRGQSISYISNNVDIQLPASPIILPTVGKFLKNLNQKYNSNIYISFEEAFFNEKITVNAIKNLSQLQKLGIVKIGWQKNIKQAAQQY